MISQEYDVTVIGAGVVGCAIARQLSRSRSVLVLEKHEGPGLETSRLNSGVIHSGIHLPPNYLKARLARQGSRMAIDFCRRHDVAYRQLGMYVVVAASDLVGLWSEIKGFNDLLGRARKQGIKVEILDPWTIGHREPNIRCVFGLWIPDVHIVSPTQFVGALKTDAEKNGVEFRFNEAVEGLGFGTTWAIRTVRDEYRSKIVINAAGLYAAAIASLAGYHYEQFFYRGEYYEVSKPGLMTNSLVYPVYRKGAPGLGIHITPTVDGRLLLGPNANRVHEPTDYTLNRTPPEVFYESVRRFFPGLQLSDLKPAYAGIRPKLSAERKENDFQIEFDNDQGLMMVNLIGIESPGLTAAMAIARYVQDSLKS